MPRSKTKPKPVKPAPDSGTDNLNQQTIWRLAILCLAILAGLFLILGRFTLGGRLPSGLYDLVALAFGWLSWTIMPLFMIYLAMIWFKQVQPRICFIRGLAGVILMGVLAGLLHVFLDPNEAQDIARQGQHGGYVGWGLVYVLQYPLNTFTSFLVLLAVGFIATFIALNLTLATAWEFIKKIYAYLKPKPSLEVASVPVKSKKEASFKLNQGVPLVAEASATSLFPGKKSKVLTVAVDPAWAFPPLDLLDQTQDKVDAGDIQVNAEIIRETLANFNIDAQMEGANVGPRVTQYTLRPPSGIKLAKIVSLESNIALDLAASSIRIEAPIPGQRAVGIEVPNQKAATVRLSSLFSSSVWQEAKPGSLAFCIGQDIAGKPEIAYLERMPHLLLAGQTGSGKSVGINVLLTSLLYRNSPSDMQLILVDPKQVELGLYNDIPHLLTPVITSPEKCLSALKWTVAEMERRLKTFASVSKRNIEEFNQLKDQPHLPFIVVVIDELADLMMVASRDVETLIVRVAQKARAAGIHLVVATQRPSVDVITGLIKANIPARIAFATASQVDSRTILDRVGAEKLLGLGDILYVNASLRKPKRLQGAFITEAEIKKVCDFLRTQRPAKYDSEVVSQSVTIHSSRSQILDSDADNEDNLFKEAVTVVMNAGKASTSLLQRRLRIGYARAARLIEALEDQGIIGPADGSRPRQVLQASLEDTGEDFEPPSEAVDDEAAD